MNITNNKSVPDVFVKAIKEGRWYSGVGETRDYSVTELLQPVKILHLTKRHKHEIETDVTESLYMLMGSALHLILERAMLNSASQQIISRARNFVNEIDSVKNISDDSIAEIFANTLMGKIDDVDIFDLAKQVKNEEYIIEKRFKYVTKSGKIITGGVDCYSVKDRTISDYKLSSVWTWIYRNRPGSRKEDWATQLNMYRLFMENMGYPVDKLCINLLFRDHSKSKAKIEANYPDPVETLELPLLGLDVVEEMIENKVAEIEKYNTVLDDGIPFCNSNERWQQHDTWAVRKVTNKTASKVEFSYADAKRWLDAEVSKLAERDIAKGMEPARAMKRASDIFIIEKRNGLPTRCESWCPVNKFCNFWQEYEKKLDNK